VVAVEEQEQEEKHKKNEKDVHLSSPPYWLTYGKEKKMR